jgi:precorrin-3B synthase
MSTLIKGWCPTPLLPMESGDGWLARLYPRRDGWSGTDLLQIAQWSQAFGNGQIEITQRCNLQLRGLTPASFKTFRVEAEQAGLIDAHTTPAMIASPGIVFDPAAEDCAALQNALQTSLAAFQAEDFPAKFVIAFDAGGLANLDDLHADIRIKSCGNQWVLSLCGRRENALPIVIGDDGDVIRSFERLLATYPTTKQRGKGPEFARRWAFSAGLQLIRPMPTLDRRQSCTGLNLAALQPAFGRISARHLETIAHLCIAEALMVTTAPARRFVFPYAKHHIVAEFAAKCDETFFILDDSDLRQNIDVCSGLPHCLNATRETVKDVDLLARHFADALVQGNRLHVSGCSKGCANPAKAAITLAADQGQYFLLRNGTAVEAVSHGSVLQMPTDKAA